MLPLASSMRSSTSPFFTVHTMCSRLVETIDADFIIAPRRDQPGQSDFETAFPFHSGLVDLCPLPALLFPGHRSTPGESLRERRRLRIGVAVPQRRAAPVGVLDDARTAQVVPGELGPDSRGLRLVLELLPRARHLCE